jgi:OPA family glycerol-3-phosphate transporter-like MFS transporter
MNKLLKSLPIFILIGIEAFLYIPHRDIFVGVLPIVVISIITYLYSLNNPVNHSRAFRIRSYFNWLTLGLTYAFLYMGRYNLTAAKNNFSEALMTKEQFGTIFGVGAFLYGISFIVNGPLADKLGGKKTMIIGAIGSAISNLILGVITYNTMTDPKGHSSLYIPFIIFYAVNMYFQSFGAVSIVKVNAAWFHIKERGVFGGIFGTLISLGIFLAFDLTGMILRETKLHTGETEIWWAFFTPALILTLFAIFDFFIIKDTPGEAGFEDFNTGDAGADVKEEIKESPIQLYIRILTHPIILIMIIIEFSSGILRNGIMHWGKQFAKDLYHLGISDIYKTDFFFQNWGLILMIAGISGGFFAGFISDKFFNSRRGPSAFFLYAGMFVGFVIMVFAVRLHWYGLIGFLSFFMSMCVIGVHGMLSGTASMDFGGKRSAATVAGVIDGFVYLGTGVQSIALGNLLNGAGKNIEIWNRWPIFLIPFTLVGLFFTWKIWSAMPDTKGGGGH